VLVAGWRGGRRLVGWFVLGGEFFCFTLDWERKRLMRYTVGLNLRLDGGVDMMGMILLR